MAELCCCCCCCFQEKATKWQDNVEIDGLTTNGILIMHPKGEFVGGSTENPGTTPWRECSVGGDVFSLRESRSAQQKGEPVCILFLLLRLLRGNTKALTSAVAAAKQPRLNDISFKM